MHYTGRLPLDVRPLTLLYTIFEEEIPFSGGASQYRPLREVPPGKLAGL